MPCESDGMRKSACAVGRVAPPWWGQHSDSGAAGGGAAAGAAVVLVAVLALHLRVGEQALAMHLRLHERPVVHGAHGGLPSPVATSEKRERSVGVAVWRQRDRPAMAFQGPFSEC